MLTHDQLIELSKINREQIVPSTLKELTEITIDPNIEIDERTEKYFNDIKNPYAFLVNGTLVTLSYNNHNTQTLDKCLYNYLNNVQNSED